MDYTGGLEDKRGEDGRETDVGVEAEVDKLGRKF
jgi:hypothetical protein